MGLQEDFLKLLEEQEQYTSTQLQRPKVKQAFDPRAAVPTPQIPVEEEKRDRRNKAWDFLGNAVWSAGDTALFNVPGSVYKRMTGEYFMEPETAAGSVGAGIGGFVGFLGAPLRVGAKIATKAASPIVKGAGSYLVSTGVGKAVKEVTAQSSSKAVKKFSKTLGKSVHSWANMARWDSKIAKGWNKFANQNIDGIVAQGVRAGTITAKEGAVVSKVFKSNFKDRPMIDIVDVVMRNYGGKKGYVIGQMIHEATMFGAIDSIMEGVHAWGDERAYDWTAPLWGVGIGGAFGALKIMKPRGKAANTWNDFKQGFQGWVGKKDAYKGLSWEKLVGNSKILGESFERSGKSEAAWVVPYKYKGKTGYINLQQPEVSLSQLGGEERKRVLTTVLQDTQYKLGREMMGKAIWEDIKSSGMNWRHLVSGTLIMNGRTIMAMSQGEEMPLEDVLTSVFLGAFINRKPMGKTYDIMGKEMRALRRNLSSLGIETGNYIDRFPSGSQGATNSLNPANHQIFKETHK